MSISIAPELTRRVYRWTQWKIVAIAKNLIHQYDDDGNVYLIWGYDGTEVHVTEIFKGTVPYTATAVYSQEQNDADKADFEANFKPTGNAPIRSKTIILASDGITQIGNVVDALKVNVTNSFAAGVADKNAFTYGSTIANAIAGVYNDTNPSLTTGTQGAIRSTQNRGLHTNLRDSSGNEITSQGHTTQRGLHIEHMDGPQIDSYSRKRVSSPNVLFAIYFSNTNHSLLLNSTTVGTASAAFNSTLGAMRLSTSTGATDSIITQTKKYLRYNPGVSYLCAVSGVFGAAKTNVRKRWGYFDTTDGLFFEQTSTGMGVVVRTSTSGSPVDTRVDQASWNIDVMDGSSSASNPSGVLLDPSKQNLYIIDFVWQGAGRIRFGVLIGGRIVYFHQISTSNTNTAAFMKSPSKPGRVELTNTGAATATTMDVVCFTTIRESNDEPLATYNFAASNGATKVTANSTTVALPVLSLRPKATFNGLTNRVQIQPTDFDVLSVQDAIFFTVLLNATLTGASFVSAGANSAAEYDISATAVSGGTVVYQGYVSGGGKGVTALTDLGDLVGLGLDIAGSVQDVITIVANKVGGNTDCYAAIRWSEYQ